MLKCLNNNPKGISSRISVNSIFLKYQNSYFYRLNAIKRLQNTLIVVFILQKKCISSKKTFKKT